MALIGAVAAAVFRTAIAVLESERGLTAEGALTKRIIDLHGQRPGQPYSAYQAIARMAKRAISAADAVTAAGGGVLGPEALPRIPFGEQGTEQYLYRLLIEVTDPNTLSVHEFAVDVVSDDQMSLNELVQQARDNFSAWSTPRQDRRALSSLSEQAHVQVTVLAAGRRS